MTSSAMVIALGILCLAGVFPALGQELAEPLPPIPFTLEETDSYSQVPQDESPASKESLNLYLAPPQRDPVADRINQVPEPVKFLEKLIKQARDKRSPHHTEDHHDNSAEGHDHAHGPDDKHDLSTDDNKEVPKNRTKRGYCSSCGAQLSYGGGGRGYGGGGRGRGYGGGGYGGCGGGNGCGGGGGGYYPQYQPQVYQQPYYGGGGGGGLCNTCQQGGGYAQPSNSYSSSSSQSSSYSSSGGGSPYGKK